MGVSVILPKDANLAEMAKGILQGSPAKLIDVRIDSKHTDKMSQMNRSERRKYFKQNKKDMGGATWQQVNSLLEHQVPYVNEEKRINKSLRRKTDVRN